MKKFVNILTGLSIVLMSFSAEAQITNQIPAGARPLGMGGAFSAVANDANSIYWNPAGLVFLQRQEITSMLSDLYGLGLSNNYLGYVMPAGDNHAFGVDWMHLGMDDNELGYRQDNFNLAYSLKLPWLNASLGSKVKMLDMDITLDGTSYGKSNGFGFDFGLLVNPFNNLRLAFVGQDVGGTSVTYDNDITEEILPQKFRFGAAYNLYEDLLLAVDIDDRVHFGAEYWLFGTFALRGGLQKDLKKINNYDRSFIYSAGFSARYRFIQIDYALEDDPDLPVTQRFGLSFYYNPSLVSIKNAAIKPVPFFRSLYRKYSEEDFAELVLKNSAQEPLPVQVRIDIPTVTTQPYEENIILEPQSTKSYPLKISLSNEILAARGSSYDNLVQPVLTVTYEQNRSMKETTRNLDPLYVLGKNKISWSNPDRVAVYVTPEDESVDRFTRTVIQEYNSLLVDKFDNSNIGKATVLFDALGKHGIVYQADRQTPWYLIAADSSIFDNIQYPVELLSSRIGDCDDCTVLFASLLGNLNIDTILLDVNAPGAGHIYLMFDSGIPVDEVETLPYESSEYVIYNNRVWIPVETTMYGHSFSSAWRNGSEEYHARKAEGYINEIDVSDAKIEYKPGQPPVEEIDIPPKEVIDELVEIDVEAFDTRINEYAIASGVSMDDPDGVYDAGAAYMRFNRNEDALRMLNRALVLRPDFGDAFNAIGVIQTKKGEYEGALQSYNRAAELMPNNAGVRVNIAITLYLMGRRNEAGEEYQKAIDMDKTFKDLLKFIRPIKRN
ncbi:tetratricopeptide repeat protein [candidate division KSB1 bacterium]